MMKMPCEYRQGGTLWVRQFCYQEPLREGERVGHRPRRIPRQRDPSSSFRTDVRDVVIPFRDEGFGGSGRFRPCGGMVLLQAEDVDFFS